FITIQATTPGWMTITSSTSAATNLPAAVPPGGAIIFSRTMAAERPGSFSGRWTLMMATAVTARGVFVPGTGGDWIIAHTYTIHGFQYVFLFHRSSRLFVPLAKLKCDRRMDIGDGEYRVDTHPRLSRNGRMVSIDASQEGLGRQMYVIDIGHILDKPPPKRTSAQ